MTTTTTDPAATLVDPRRSPWLRVIGAFVVGLSLVAVVAVGAVVAFDHQYAARVIPGTTVGAVDLSGLDRETARARLADAFGALGEGRVVVGLGSDQVDIPYAVIGRRADVETMLDEALAIGHEGAPLERLADTIRVLTNGIQLQPRATVDQFALERVLGGLAADLERQPVNAFVTRTTTGFVVSAGQEGQRVEWSRASQSAGEALLQSDASPEIRVNLSIVSVEPTVTHAEAVEARIEAELMAHDVVIADGNETWTIPANEVRTWISFGAAGADAYTPIVDSQAANAAIGALAPAMKRVPKEAKFLTGKNGAVVGVSPSQDGRTLNLGATVDLVATVLRGRAAGVVAPSAPIQAAVDRAAPQLATSEAEKVAPLMKPISSWTTYYQVSGHNAFGANITVPTLAIDGTVLAPGETFDFWDAIGEVSVERGYGYGGAIIDGRTVEGKTLAGGICSCSTTLFNAALRAGYQMGSRRNHYYYISRYPLGLDATVYKSDYGTVQTMSFTNDTEYPLLIRGYAKPGTVRFTIWSVPNGRTVELTKPIVKNVRPATTEIQYTTSLKPGARRQVEWPADGKEVWVTRIVRDAGGAIIHEETYHSRYARITGLILVGKAAEIAPTPSPSPSPSPTPAPSPSPNP